MVTTTPVTIESQRIIQVGKNRRRKSRRKPEATISCNASSPETDVNRTLSVLFLIV